MWSLLPWYKKFSVHSYQICHSKIGHSKLVSQSKLCVFISDIRALENDAQLQSTLNDEDNNRVIVQFQFETSAMQLPKNITYALRMYHNG
jgi:hypothetical protein